MTGIAYSQFSTILPFLFILFLGYLCGKFKIIDSNSAKTIGGVTVNFLSPFMVINFLQTPRTEEKSSILMWGFLSALIIFAVCYLISFLFYLRKKKDTSSLYACSMFSSALPILAYPLLSNVSGETAKIYTAVFIIANQLFFAIGSGKLMYKNRPILKCIINSSFLISLVGILLYFMNCKLILPISNTVLYISNVVPTISVLLIGIFLASFPLKGFKLQLDIIIVSVFKLFLLPILTLGICLIAKFSFDTTLTFVILSGLPCGIELEYITSLTQNKNLSCSANVTAFSFALSTVSIPVMCYISTQIFSMVK